MKQHPRQTSHKSPFDQNELRRAIQVLDSVSTSTLSKNQTTLKALCTVMRLVISLSFQRDDRALIETVIQARVLGKLRRFISYLQNRENHENSCCSNKCHLRLQTIAVVWIIFYLCRDPCMAVHLVREEFHVFLASVCSARHESTHLVDAKDYDQLYCRTSNLNVWEPKDLLTTFDPFDWCHRMVGSSVLKDREFVRFSIPTSARSLIYILSSNHLPLDEVEEFEIGTRCQVPPYTSPSQCQSPGRRTLPSIFNFVSKAKHDASNATKGALCVEHRSDSIFRYLLKKDDAPCHEMALRALVLLLYHLNPSSVERKRFLLHGAPISSLLRIKHGTGETQEVSTPSLDTKDTVRDSCTESMILFHLVSSGLAIVSQSEWFEISSMFPQDERIQSYAKMVLKHNKLDQQSRKACDQRCTTLERKLFAAEKCGKTLTRKLQKEILGRNDEMERSQCRYRVQMLYQQAENLRSHFAQGLGVLCNGRERLQREQLFQDWIHSLPTIESKLQDAEERRQEMQRQALEAQYGIVQERRREREELVLMREEDVDMTTLVVAEAGQRARQEHFQLLQHKLHILTQTQKVSSTESIHPRRSRKDRQKEADREALERKRMVKEDVFYAEKIIRERLQAKNPTELKEEELEAQRRCMLERKQAEVERQKRNEELSLLAVEDILSRRVRLHEEELRRKEIELQWKCRKEMSREERELRQRWEALDREMIVQQELQAKQIRAEERRKAREERRAIAAAWFEAWDDYGNVYYYNTITGISQWEYPSDYPLYSAFT